MEYLVDSWLRQDWRKDTRRYSCELRQNLFGQWVVLRRWGRMNTLKGQSIEHVCASYDKGIEIMSAVEKRRARRGYISD